MCIGSASVAKIAAVVRAFGRYPELWSGKGGVEFICPPSSITSTRLELRRTDENKNISHKSSEDISGVGKNPLTLGEIFAGARNRSLYAYEYATKNKGSCDFGVGLEAGIFPVKETNTGFMDVSICTIHDGTQFFLGGSPLFEYPQKAVNLILKGVEAGALKEIFGEGGKGRKGVIGPLSGERIFRDEFEELAVLMALCPIVSRQLYQNEAIIGRVMQ